MSITRIQNNQITDSTIVAYAKLQSGSLTGNLFAPTITLNSNVTINGNLFLSNTGNTTTINATNTYINDPLVVFNNGYTGSLSGYDIGMLVNRNLSALAPYGSAVNSAWVWVENDQAFESLITTDTGTGATSINNSGYANVKTGNTTMVSGSVTGTLTVTGATTLTTANVGGLQAVAIGNVTAGTGAFTTLGASGIVTITNATQNTGAGSGALQVTGGAYIGGNLYVAGNINASVSGPSGVFLGNAGGQGALFAGISGGYLTEPMATFQTTANVNQYAGVVNGQNINKGPLASTDIFLSPDNGTYNDGYLDLGIASSTYNYPGFGLILPNDAYLFSWGNATTGGGNLIIGTGATNDIVFATGGINQNNTVMRITSGNVVAIKSTNSATNTTSGALQVAGGVGVQGAIYAGSIQNTPVGSTTASTGSFTSLNAASGLTASTVSAATIGNAGAALSGSTTTLTGLLTASAVNAATIGNAGANAQFGFVTATTVNAATIGNASTAGQFGTVTATTVNAATIGNTGAAVTGSTATFGGLQAAAIGNVTPGSGSFTTGTFSSTLGVTGATTLTTATTGGLQAVAIGNVTPGTGNFTSLNATGTFTAATVNAATVNALTLGNVGATIYGTGTNITALSAANINGTVATANVSYYDAITASTTNATFYPAFFDKTSGNGQNWVSSSLTYNASTGALSATTFSGAGTFTTGTFSSTLGVTGATTLTTATTGGLQAAAIGNVTPGTGVFTTGTFNTATTGGLQAAAIGNVTPGTGAFTTVTGSSFQGIIGNATATTAFFTTANATNVYAATIGNVGTTLNGSLNGAGVTGTVATANVAYYDVITPLNNNQTYYLEFANVTSGNSLTGAVTTVNVNPSTSTISAGTFNGTSITLTGPDNNSSQYNSGALQIVGGAGISGNLYVAGNVYAGNLISTTTQILEVTDPLLYLNANTPSNYNYEIGFYSHFGPFGSTPYQHTGFVRDHTAGIWKLFANTPEPAGGTVNFANSTWEALQIGNLIVANTTAATGTTQATGGALYVAGGAGIAGALYAGSIQNTPVGSTTASTGSFTSLNAASGLTASTVQAATIGNAAASGQFGTVTATTVNAATIGNAGAALSGATTTLTGLLTASAVNAATIGNAAASGQFGTVTATNVYAATVGNAGANGQFGFVTATTVNAATIGNAAATGQFGTVTATTINAATIGNTGAQFSGNTATFAGNITAGNITTAGSNGNISGVNTVFATTLVGNLSAANVVGTVATANVAVYEQIIPLSNNQTYYIPFANVTNGNSTLGATSAIAANPSSGNVYATQFIGSGAYLTNINPSSIGQVATANASIYIGVNNNTSGGTYYPMLSGQSTTGNTQAQVNGSLSYVPNTGTLSATAFNGSGTSYIQTLQVNGQLSASGAIIAGSGVATTNNSTGALQVTGGTAITGNINVGGQMFVGTGAQATSLTGAIAVKRSTSTTGPGTQYTQDALINATNSGSSDFIAYANNYPGPSNDHGWMDMGFTGDAFSDPVYSITKANDGYLFASAANSTVGGNLVLSTDWTGSYNDVVVGVGSFYSNSEVARFHGNASTSGTFSIKLPTNASPAANTGALQVWGGASFGGNMYVGGGTIFNGSKTAGYDTIVKGASDNTLIWARPNATYDTVIIGNSATASTVVNGAKLNINTTDSILLPVGTNAQRPGSAGYSDVAGMLRYSSTANAIEWYTGSSWQTASTNFTVIADQQFTGTGSTPTFTLSTSQTTNSCIVSINGVLQIPTLAYSVSGTTLTFTENPANGDVIDVRMLTTTSTVTGIADTSGYNTVNVITGTGVTFTTGTVAQTTQYTIDTNGGFVTNGSNVTIASAGTSVVDNLFANSYSSAKYTITATLAGTNIREITEVLMVHTGNGAGAGSVYMSSYGRVNTAGNTLVTYSGSTSGNIAQLQATTTNANTILRIKRDYMAI